MRIKLISPKSVAILVFVATLPLFSLLFAGASNQDFDGQLKTITKPYHFSIARWELNTFTEAASKVFNNPQKTTDDGVREVTEYFSNVKRIKELASEIEVIKAGNRQGNIASLEAELSTLQQQNIAVTDTVESILEVQIRDTLTEQGIFNSIAKLKISFPPVNFKLEKLPYVLVVSPKEKIESIREITLEPSLSLEETEDIEARAYALGVSSLVVEIGGFSATYPSLVSSEGSLRFTIDAIAEEWLHQYLVLKPLGFRYLLDVTGLSRNYEIAVMNETLAGMVSEEIGFMLYEKYYYGYENGARITQSPASGFDFNREMREIRKAVDTYLAQGGIKEAEEFMEQKRQYLASNGYYIRKLNQAYFAFHGAYSSEPAFISPIGLELKELRNRSASLKDFLNTVAAMTSHQDLIGSIK